MDFHVTIPTPNGELDVVLSTGSSTFFVGANGGGKTRLAARIEDQLAFQAHRISAHRAQTLNQDVVKIGEARALSALKTGRPNVDSQIGHRDSNRWAGKKAVSLLNDFDFLVQFLFAEQTNKALDTHKRNRAGDFDPSGPTKFEELAHIWAQLLPHRQLIITGDDIQVSGEGIEPYSASEMSDGERAIFYLIGQTLAASEESVLIFDEPELHIHRAILAKVIDELEAARQDCCFVFITHDLELASARVGMKYVISDYVPMPQWSIVAVPENEDFDEKTTTMILGSRVPILFVEGTEESLDIAIYRNCLPEWTVVPRGSCEEVIHSVTSMRNNAELTRITCAGIVDRDDYQENEIAYLNDHGVAVLRVAEIENIFLLPNVSRAIATSHGYEVEELDAVLAGLVDAVFLEVNSDATIESAVRRYCRRRIDRILKKIDLSAAATVEDIVAEYETQTTEVDINFIADAARDRITAAIENADIEALLATYDNKGLIALAGRALKDSGAAQFKSWATRVLNNGSVPELSEEILNILPDVDPL